MTAKPVDCAAAPFWCPFARRAVLHCSAVFSKARLNAKEHVFADLGPSVAKRVGGHQRRHLSSCVRWQISTGGRVARGPNPTHIRVACADSRRSVCMPQSPFTRAHATVRLRSQGHRAGARRCPARGCGPRWQFAAPNDIRSIARHSWADALRLCRRAGPLKSCLTRASSCGRVWWSAVTRGLHP